MVYGRGKFSYAISSLPTHLNIHECLAISMIEEEGLTSIYLLDIPSVPNVSLLTLEPDAIF